MIYNIIIYKINNLRFLNLKIIINITSWHDNASINNNHNWHVKSFNTAIEGVSSNVTDYTFFYSIYLMYEVLKLEFVYVNFLGITMDGTKYMNYTIFFINDIDKSKT